MELDAENTMFGPPGAVGEPSTVRFPQELNLDVGYVELPRSVLADGLKPLIGMEPDREDHSLR
jgi:hypothetical protein